MTTEDVERRLEKFLMRQLPNARTITVSDYEPIGGGYSHIMGRFTACIDDEARHLVARREQPTGKAVVVSDRRIEWAVVDALTKQGCSFLPATRWFDAEGSDLGTSTIIVDFIEGETFTARMLSAGDTERDDLTEKLCQLVAQIHAVGIDVLPKALERPASWDAYLSDAIDAWRRTESGHVEANPFLGYVACWLEANRPEPAPLTLVHGDMQPPNVMVTPERLVAVDWEFPHIGDPREDLGWLKMIEGMSPLPVYSRDEEGFCRRYRELTGLEEDVINPRSVAYFSILSVIRIYTMLYEQIAAFTRGENRAISVAYSASVALTLSHDQWCRLIRQLDEERASWSELTS